MNSQIPSRDLFGIDISYTLFRILSFPIVCVLFIFCFIPFSNVQSRRSQYVSTFPRSMVAVSPLYLSFRMSSLIVTPIERAAAIRCVGSLRHRFPTVLCLAVVWVCIRKPLLTNMYLSYYR